MQKGRLQAYLVLRWLLLENPPPSRTTEEAWTYIAALEAHPYIVAGWRHQKTQRAKARLPRGRLTEQGETMRDVVASLANTPENRDLTAKELWPKLFALLDETDLSPVDAPAGDDHIRYEVWGLKPGSAPRSKTITFGTFSNLVSKARKTRSR